MLDIQPGDSFIVTYQEIEQDGEYIKDGPILAASFVNQGREYRAVRYTDPDGAVRYYTPGRPQRVQGVPARAPAVFPDQLALQPGRAAIPSSIASARTRAWTTLPPPARRCARPATGASVFAGRKGGYGNVIEIDHSRGVVTRYGHLSTIRQGHPRRQARRAGLADRLSSACPGSRRARICTTNIR